MGAAVSKTDPTINLARITLWRQRADRYHALAENADSVGTQLAYRALAACANDLAERLQQGWSAVQ